MYAVFLLTLIIAIAAAWDFGADRGRLTEQAWATADQMAAYHQAAIRTCLASPCPAGTVDPSGELPFPMAGQALYEGGRFRSVSDGGTLVWTYYVPPGGQDVVGFYGPVSMALAERWGDAISAGAYDADTQTVTPRAVMVGGVALPVSVAVPNGVGGNQIPDGAPVIATRLQ